MTKFRYTDAQDECDNAREVLIKKRIDKESHEAESYKQIFGELVETGGSQRCAEDIMLINDVLDYVKRQFYINWEDK